jgi:hypothetical protein
LHREVVENSRKSEAERVRILQRSMAIEAFAIGTLEVVKSAAAFASLNIPQGVAHAAAAGLAFAKGGLLLSGQIGPGAASAGGRPSAAGSSSSQTDRRSPGTPSEIPTSDRRSERPPALGQQTAGISIGVIQINALKPNKQIVRELRDELEDLAYQEKTG